VSGADVLAVFRQSRSADTRSMTFRPMAPARLRLGLVLAGGMLLAGALGTGGGAAAATVYSTSTPMILSGPTPADLDANMYGICDGSFQYVIRNVAGATSARAYLDAAQRCGLKAILYFTSTVSGGTVYPSRVAPLVNAVKTHPALFGYLSVKEPSWVGISASEIRAMYKAFRAADPAHPVIAQFGDSPHFGGSTNPYTAGMANIVMIGWYPVETANGGRSTTGTSYVTTGPTNFARNRSFINKTTPGTPVWLMIQTHKYLAPATHKKQLPSSALINRQAREGFVYLSAKGIAFHIWSNTNYNVDERRSPTTVQSMKNLANAVHAGTFQ
jgi:hypothetical protein